MVPLEIIPEAHAWDDWKQHVRICGFWSCPLRSHSERAPPLMTLPRLAGGLSPAVEGGPLSTVRSVCKSSLQSAALTCIRQRRTRKPPGPLGCGEGGRWDRPRSFSPTPEPAAESVWHRGQHQAQAPWHKERVLSWDLGASRCRHPGWAATPLWQQ